MLLAMCFWPQNKSKTDDKVLKRKQTHLQDQNKIIMTHVPVTVRVQFDVFPPSNYGLYDAFQEKNKRQEVNVVMTKTERKEVTLCSLTILWMK